MGRAVRVGDAARPGDEPQPRDAAPAKLEKGHGRGRADRTDRNLRGVPVIGHGSGAVSGTSPGSDAHLEQIGRRVVVRKGPDSLVIQERLRAARITLRYDPPR